LAEHRELKIPPNNQSLILAGEPGGSRGVPLGVPDSLLGQASRLVAGAALKRVTILASRPDATVVVQADYYSRNDGPPVDSRLGDPGGLGDPSNGAPAVGAANSVTRSHSATLGGPATLGRSVTLSSYFNPIELYTRTQRGFDHSPRAGLLDVLA
jgi:hypothetical protein